MDASKSQIEVADSGCSDGSPLSYMQDLEYNGHAGLSSRRPSKANIDEYDYTIEKVDARGYVWKCTNEICIRTEKVWTGTKRRSQAIWIRAEDVVRTSVPGAMQHGHECVFTSAIIFLSIVLFLSVVISDLRATSRASSSRVGFQLGFDRRSTMDIVYSCMATMVICTISAVHIDLPEHKSHRKKFLDKIRSLDYYEDCAKKVVRWAVGLLMPEVAVWWACGDYYNALDDCAFMQDKCEGWALKHSLFARMGGFTLREGDSLDSGRALLEAGAVLDKKICDRLGHEISDKSKADVLSKSLAVVQITRFLLEIIARAVDSLPISPLEYFTCAQVFCALLMYNFWFDKPHGVHEKIHLESNFDDRRVVEEKRVDSSNLRLKVGHLRWSIPIYAAALVASSVLASWNKLFANTTITWLWRAFSIASAVLPFVFLAILTEFVRSRRFTDSFSQNAILNIVALTHGLVRLSVLSLVLYSFNSLPEGVYVTESWLDFLPFFH